MVIQNQQQLNSLFYGVPLGFRALRSESPRPVGDVVRAIDGTSKGGSVGAKSAPTQVRVGASSEKNGGVKPIE